jgi:trimeric autotransporter adhesin
MRFLITTILFTSLAFGQTFQGSLRGRVLDQSGASEPSAKVTISDEATKFSRSSVTNDQGEYVFSAVAPSTYTLTVEAAGFKKSEQKGIEVATHTAVGVDVTLQVGQVTDSVDVVADAPPLDTESASTGQQISTQQIEDLPSLGRNSFFFAKLAQSVVFANNPIMGRMQDQNANSQVSIAGGPIRTNNALVDGISITDSNNRAVFIPSPEAVQEVKLQANTYDADAGRTGGGTFNSTLKSGTNDLHGSAVGHIRFTDLLANNYFSNASGQARPNQPFKDWAASLGGPVIIPKVFNGRNKLFFFVATESYRELDPSNTYNEVPTLAERNGDFSQSLYSKGGQQVIYDPLNTTAAGARIQFPSNIIPASRLSPIGLALASYYPLPNQPTPYYGSNNYIYTGAYPNRGDQYTNKLDDQLTSWLRLSGSYIHQKTGETDNPSTFGNIASPGQTLLFRRIDATAANATATLNPTTVLTVRWGFNRFYSATFPTASAGFNLTTLGFPQSLQAITPDTAFPAVTMSDLTSYGGGSTNSDVYYSRTADVTLAKFAGKHSIKAGFDFRTLHDYGVPATGPTSLSFSPVFTQAVASTATPGTGASLATELLGYPTGGSMTLISPFDDFLRYFGGYVQDDYRVSSKLTVNFGLRLEHESGIQEENNHLISSFNPTAVNPAAALTGIPINGGVEYAGVNGNPTQTGNPLAVKFSPRAGFAYSIDPKTVVRGGYGIYWAPSFFSFQNTLGYSQTTSIVTSTNGNVTPAASLANPYPNGLIQPTGDTLGGLSGLGQALTVFSPTSQSAGYVQEYSVELQRQAPGGIVLTTGFIGSHSLHLNDSGQNINQLNPSFFSLGDAALTKAVANPFYGITNVGVGSLANKTVSQEQLLLPFPQYTSVALNNNDTGRAIYYSVYVRGQRRLAKGLTLLASYTWSRNETDVLGVSTAGASGITGISGAQNAYNLGAEWSLATQDVPNRFTTAITYQLPFGKGQQFLRNSQALDEVVGGWQLNVTSIIQSGFPLDVTQTNANSVIGASYQLPNATGVAPQTSGSTDSRLGGSNGSTGWLNPLAFSQAPVLTFGDISRFLNVRGPGLYNWDASLFKTFSIKEKVKAQFRAEALNVTNTPQFGNPSTSINSLTFGQITSQINHPRIIQLGVRFTF